ncbi:MAG TPA: glycosyltransferase family 2 protein [Clostridiales bacterium]|nr:glycosyltransferase family 2 protein [Clostridiales bacterium]
MEREPLVTVILPMYNAETFLPRCMESVLNQTYQNFILLIIDDGSTDESKGIINTYVQKDPRIRYVRKENEGVAIARNLGIEIVQNTYSDSKYTYFIDADDCIALNMIETLVREAEESNAGLVMCNFYYWYEYGTRKNKAFDRDERMGHMQYALRILKKPMSFYYGVLWNKLYRTKDICGIRFTTAVALGEDFIFNLKLIPGLKRVSIISKPLYYYRKFGNPGALTARGRDLTQAFNNRLVMFAEYKQLYQDLGLYELNRNRILDYMVASIYDLKFFEEVYFKENKEQVEQYREHLSRLKIRESYLKEMPMAMFLLRSGYYYIKKQLLIIRHYYRMLRAGMARRTQGGEGLLQ